MGAMLIDMRRAYQFFLVTCSNQGTWEVANNTFALANTG